MIGLVVLSLLSTYAWTLSKAQSTQNSRGFGALHQNSSRCFRNLVKPLLLHLSLDLSLTPSTGVITNLAPLLWFVYQQL